MVDSDRPPHAFALSRRDSLGSLQHRINMPCEQRNLSLPVSLTSFCHSLHAGTASSGLRFPRAREVERTWFAVSGGCQPLQPAFIALDQQRFLAGLAYGPASHTGQHRSSGNRWRANPFLEGTPLDSRQLTLPKRQLSTSVLLVFLAAVCGLPNSTAHALDGIAPLVHDAIEAGNLPGAVIMVADQDHVLYAAAFGDRQLEPSREPMMLDTVFDLASLTKPIATATSVMRLVQDEKLALERPVADYLPAFAANGKGSIRVCDLLLHQGGLIADNSLADYADGSEAAWNKICQLPALNPPGETFVYSDVGFIVLGELVRQVSGQTLDQFTTAQLFRPLGMQQTRFYRKPPPAAMLSRFAPTERRQGQWLLGQVHDPRAAALGGVAGHAGLFSTAGDLVTFGQMLLGQGTHNGTEILDPSTFEQMTAARQVSRGQRGYGWDVKSPYSSNRGNSFSSRAFGHGGFTGTVFWVDPQLDLVFVFLSSRLHPDGVGSVNKLAGEIATLVGQAAERNELNEPSTSASRQ